ncbi:hypothetical protein R3P38DRAFT_3072397 [Favolaschia claudopus]|uniref:Uncharacterized protein n=1 Tax=Favolaschia claudopus TaxID=2862362 RepID=A0AAV9ZYL6_9AGAR
MGLDVWSILKVSALNRYFNNLAFTQQVWLAIVRNLGEQGLVDLPTEAVLGTLTPKDVIEEIKRVVIGPQTWHDCSYPKSVRDHVLDLTFVPRASGLMPGGRYIYASDHQQFHLFKLDATQSVWSWKVPSLMQLVGLSVGPITSIVTLDSDRGFHLFAIQVDMDLGNSSEVLHFYTTAMDVSPVAVWQSYLVYHTSIGFLFLNWVPKEFVFLEETPHAFSSYAFSSGYLFHLGSPDRLCLHFITSFDGLWRPLDEFDQRITQSIQDLPGTLIWHLPESNDVKTSVLGIQGNPLHPDSFVVVLSQPTTHENIVSRYEINLVVEKLARLLTRVAYPPALQISDAGYCIRPTQTAIVVFHPSRTKKKWLFYRKPAETTICKTTPQLVSATLSASGAVTICTKSGAGSQLNVKIYK